MTTLACATWARETEVDPIGSAGTYAGFLLVERARPWPRDAADVPELTELAASLKAYGIRLQLVEPVDGVGVGADLPVRVVLHQRPEDDWFGGYVAREARCAPADVVATALALLGGGGAPTMVKDVLVCTHGVRDTCCGSLGTRLAVGLAAGGLPTSVRLWRTSHLGGHRFAPTALVLPEGTAWAYLTVDDVLAIVGRSSLDDALLAKYRGCAGLPSSSAQALERAALGQVGWSWFDGRRRAEASQGDRIAISWDGPAAHQRWEGLVVPGRQLDVPGCRGAGTTTTEAELVVAAFRYDTDEEEGIAPR